ncbi:hypothetical protein NDU88_006080 [Pleurodeles waltl]|uniref:Uncharacterized protein n=1 Tax=Pleurodeles waltl TaxID=8319 RepID=A0AAV7SNM5_PLEWA|nr:hypothetical protein NDU88_006080 [Pleurodeles waltl]
MLRFGARCCVPNPDCLGRVGGSSEAVRELERDEAGDQTRFLRSSFGVRCCVPNPDCLGRVGGSSEAVRELERDEAGDQTRFLRSSSINY